MLNGSLVNGIDSSKLNSRLLMDKVSRFSGRSYVVFVHDGSDIRKPYSEVQEHLGWVRDLDGQWVRGYSTLNTVGVDLQGNSVDLLYCTPYSSQLPEYVSGKERKLFDTGQLKDPVRYKEIESWLSSDLAINYKKLLFAQIKQVSQAAKQANPDMMVLHVRVRYQDDAEVFKYIAELGDYFVIRLKKNHKDTDNVGFYMIYLGL